LKKIITLAELRATPSTAPSTQQKTYAAPGKKIVTRNGCMINFHGTFFFSDAAITERRPWKLTKTSGVLPNAQEWSRLQKEVGLESIVLTADEELAAQKIATTMAGNPELWLTKEEKRKYLQRKRVQQENQREPEVLACGDFIPATTNLGALLKTATK
jgi:hypothetical protein